MEAACPTPCHQRGYKFNLEYMHRNTFVNLDESMSEEISSTFYLSVMWDSMLVEEEVEALVYDWLNFVAAAGGNLGLLLGFSCFGLFLLRAFESADQLS